MSDWNGPLCVTAGTSEIPCHEWLYGDCSDGARPPDHICPGVMAWSVRYFIEQRAGGDWQAAFDGFWPLPAGAHAIQEWPAHAEEAATNWAVLHSMHENPDIGAFRVRDVPPVDLPRWYFPIVPNNADALVGLAAQRHIDGVGSVWLLGLVESADVDTWVWAQPEILIEASPAKPSQLTKLYRGANKLFVWYSEKLLGKKFRTGGRRPAFKTPDQFIQKLMKSHTDTRKRSCTKEQFAEAWLGIDPKTFDKYLRALGFTWDDVTQDSFGETLGAYIPPPRWPWDE